MRTASASSTSRQTLAAAAGWTNVPASFSPAKQTTFTHANAQIPGGGVWDLYIYDSTNDGRVNYDHVLIVNSADAKDGSKAVANLRRGEWADAKLKLVSGSLVGKTAGFYAKLIDLNADASQFRLYFTSVQRLNASYNALGPAGSDAFVETLAANFPTSTAADFAPLEALIVDEDTYVEQGLMWADAHFAYLNYIVNTLGYKPDALFLGSPVTDEFSHQFLGLLTKTDLDGRPNPYYDDVNGDGTKDRLLDKREGYIRAAYHEADATLALGRRLMGKKDTTVFASSDHGFAPQWLAINARKLLFETTVRNTVTGARRLGPSERQSGRGVPESTRRHTAQQLPCPAGRSRPGQGVLGRRDDAVLRQPDAAGRRHVRGGARRDHRQVLRTHRPGDSWPPGDPQGDEEGRAAQRRRHRLAAPEPQR